jgi:hypothetical protein
MDAVLNLGLVFGLYQSISYFKLDAPENFPFMYASSLLCQLLYYYYLHIN